MFHQFINFSPVPRLFDQIYRLLIDSSSTPCSRRFTSIFHCFLTASIGATLKNQQ
nr:MAG TPA: hypothetical protein [Caudoviricetes sp.]